MEYTGFGFSGYDEDAVGSKQSFESTYEPPVNRQTNETNVQPAVAPNVARNKRETDLSTIIGTMKIEMAKPTSELTDDHVSAARMAKAAQEHFESGSVNAQRYLDFNGIRKTIVSSNRYGVMLRDNETGNTPTRVESLEGSPDGGPANRILVEVRLYKLNRGECVAV
jgi:hypothetical protein